MSYLCTIGDAVKGIAECDLGSDGHLVPMSVRKTIQIALPEFSITFPKSAGTAAEDRLAFLMLRAVHRISHRL
jgi:hypothetical protein